MGQHLSNANSQTVDLTQPDRITLNPVAIVSSGSQEDVNLFLSVKTSVDTSERSLIKQIRNHISLLANVSEFEMTNAQINNILMANVFISIISDYKRKIEEIRDVFEKQKQFKISLTNKLEEDKKQTKIPSNNQEQQRNTELNGQHSSFASKLSTLFKSAENNVSTVIHHLFESQKNDVDESALSNGRITERQVEKILLNFSTTTPLLKHVLPLISQLVFDAVNVYDVRNAFIQLNKRFEVVRNEWQEKYINESRCHSNLNAASAQDNSEGISSSTLTYLTSIGAFPNQQLKKFHKNRFSGQFISVFLCAHIDFDNTINASKQFQSGSIISSMSFEFHPNTFKLLFHIIEQITAMKTEHLNENLVHILILCLRLFTTHLKFLSIITTNLHRDLLATNENFKETIEISSSSSNKGIELNEYATDDELRIWLDTLLILACRVGQKPAICREASKAIIYVLDKKATSFIEKLSFTHKYIIENKHSVLIEQLLIELNTNAALLCWIEVLCHSDDTAFTILYSLIDIYLNSSSNIKTQRIEQVLQTFQQLLFMRLRSELSSSTFSLATKYLIYILSHSNGKLTIINDILIGLCLMTDTETQFDFATIQPICTVILPVLAEFILHKRISSKELTDYSHWALGKMSHVLMVGPLQDSLELNYIEKLQSSLFAGGCESIRIIENNPYILNLFQSNIAIYSQSKLTDYNQQQSLFDQEFLMSIYNNNGQGAQLISKMKMYHKDKQHLLQNSIEQQANGACAALFAVYIKHYRRINLAKNELSRTNNQKPHYKLLSLFEYANRIQTLFATTKGQGGDCNELYEQIQMKTLFLLSSIKESHFISIIESQTEDHQIEQKHQYSRRKIEKHSFRLVRNLIQVCIRFKKLILMKKKAIEQKQDNESILNRAIDTYVYSNENHSQSNELIQCMSRQYERAMTRLINYRFIYKFIEKLLKIEEKNFVLTFLNIYLPYLRNRNIEWYYLENISAINIQLKDEIGNIYYSIIQIILSYLTTTIEQTTILQRNIFNLLNLSYQSEDIYYLNHYELLEKLFISFVQKSDRIISLDVKLIGYNWFRLYVFKLCEQFAIEELNQKREFVFNKLIFNELKRFNEQLSNENVEYKKNSFNNAAIGWFLKTTTDVSSKVEMELCTIQWLMFLLRCVHSYEHVRSLCANINYIEELLYIYRHSENQTTILLALKIVRKLILFLPDNIDEKSRTMMKNFLNEILFSIDNSFSSQRITSDIVTELIYIYRVLISFKSSWQIMAIQIIASNLKSIDINQIKNVVAELYILGGYVQPFCLGSVVKIFVGDEINNETQLGVIIDIDINARDSGTDDTRPYFVQYTETNKTEWISADKLRIKIDVPPPNLLALPNANEFIHLLFDTLGYFIQIDNTSSTESLLVLQLKRRSIATLYRILTSKSLIEIFMEKPYASIIAKLSISALLSKHHQQPTDLRLFNKRHLEQYCLSLDRSEHVKQIIEDTTVVIDKDKSCFTVWNDVPFKQTMNFQLMNISDCYEWKPDASKKEIQLFKQGRIGKDEIIIVPMPLQLSVNWVLEECGTTHRFPGRTYLISENSEAILATFIVDNLRLNQGNWYYCVRLLGSCCAQIGWATTGFNPSNTSGIGNDKYSWAFDGSEGTLYNNEQYPFLSEDICWNENDVCGCGIEINDENIRINYWLNGHFLGTAFAHQFPINLSTTICDMLPNGRSTTYFPGVSLKVNDTKVLSSCEFIFSPEDMFECPLPKGYKPLLIPKLIHLDNLLVPYPYSAYLIDDNNYKTRNNNSVTFLRDFVNNNHLETTFIYDKHQLILSQESGGFPLTIDHHESLTISFDFQILTPLDNVDILLFTFDDTPPETFSVRIPSNKIDHQTRTAIVFHSNDQQMKIYINNECQTIEYPIKTKFNIHILPMITVGIRNLAIWKYALSEEYIRRLFTWGLIYVAMDYHRLIEYRKQMNTLTFTRQQQYFTNELLVPFSEPFDENKWEKKKQEADNDEWKYFKSNEATIQLFGNKTYLVLDKSINPWLEYTIILDISIVQLPTKNEQLTLIALNSQSIIYLTHDGQFCLSVDHRTTFSNDQSKIKLNEYIRLLISVQEKSIKIYINGLLELDTNVTGDQLMINDKRIDLFREQDLTKNTIEEDTLRIQCKSITYLNRATIIIDEKMTSSNYSLETIVLPPYFIIAPSLIQIGYDESRIKSAMNQNMTNNIQSIDTILREDILSKLGPLIDKEKLKDLLHFSQFDTDEKKLTALAEVMLRHSDDIQTLSSISLDKKWIQDHESTSIEEIDLTHQLIDINAHVQEHMIIDIEEQRKKIQKSIQYSHQQINHQQYYHSRISCENGLISMYAHYTILNILRIWSNDESNLFPLEKFGDCTFIITLLRLLDYHYVYTRMHTDENIDRMSSLIISILENEKKYHILTHEKTPLLYQLQMNIMIQLIQFLLNPSLLSYDYGDQSTIIDKQSMIKQPNLNFILKLINIFVKFITNKSTRKQHEIDFLISLLFPVSLINLLFDLFLIGPMHQSKIIILRCFSTLLQASNNFNLNRHIQHFLFDLFVKFPPNSTSMNTRTMKTFQITIMDLVFLLFERQKYQRIEMNTTSKLVEFDFSKNFHDLLMVIDVINALTDKTKHTPFPEVFVLQSIVLLEENIRFTLDDIEKSNTHFDVTADLQLIHFMNNHPLLHVSFHEFINSLPTESVPNPTFYKIYPFLWHIPAIYIQTRAIIFYQLNMFLTELVSIIDFSQLPGQSILTDKILTAKVYMLYQTKFELFNKTLEITALPSDGNTVTVNFDTVKASISTDHDHHTMFSQAYEQLHNNAHLLFRRTCDQLWLAQYLAMHSTDRGGPYRDSISCICSDICSTRLSLFILCPNGRTNSGLNRDRWIPNVFPPNKSISNRIKKQYQFIGQLMGMAIRQKHYLDLKFPILFWKQLVKEQVTVEDIEAIDAQSFTMINEVKKTIKQNTQLIDTDNDINDLLSSILSELRFEAVSSAGQTYELVPDGGKIPITASNFNKYCSSYCEYRLNEFHRQIEFIRQGLYSVVPGYFLSLFTPDELEEAVCGKGEIDVNLLKRNTGYGGSYDENSQAILRFWTILSEMFTEEQKKLFLKFVWGRCTLPKNDDDFTSKFRIDPYDVSNGPVDGALPRSHTCSFVLDLPDYSSIDIMYDRLNYAITYCSTIDGDGNMNEGPVLTDVQSDSTADEQ